MTMPKCHRLKCEYSGYVTSQLQFTCNDFYNTFNIYLLYIYIVNYVTWNIKCPLKSGEVEMVVTVLFLFTDHIYKDNLMKLNQIRKQWESSMTNACDVSTQHA